MEATLYDKSASKKPTNLSINSDLLKQAKSYKLNLSKLLEERLDEVLRQKKAQEWLRENEAAIQRYNLTVAEEGMFGDEVRGF